MVNPSFTMSRQALRANTTQAKALSPAPAQAMFLFTTTEPRFAPSSAAPDGLSAAIRAGAAKGGASSAFLTAVALRESSLRPDAKAPTSSATGLYQFIDDTWLRMVRDEGAGVGLSREAAAIGSDRAGRPVVADAAARDAILDLRRDPEAASALAARLAARNAASLRSALGRPPNESELYLAHVLGASDAAKALRAAASTPDVSAAAFFPAAAAANPGLFRDRAGAPRSIAALVANVEEGFRTARAQAEDRSTATQDATAPSAARTGFSFDGLFRTAAPAQPLDLSSFRR